MSEPELDFIVDLKPRGECEVCKWVTAPSLQAKGRAFQHLRTRGHRVKIITESIEWWQPKEEETQDGTGEEHRLGGAVDNGQRVPTAGTVEP